MVIVLVRTVRRKDSDDAEYATAGKRMVELASKIPGFVSYESVGPGIGVGTFESLDALDAWGRHPEHVKTQQRGREAFYDSYLIQVCEVIREHRWTRPPATA